MPAPRICPRCGLFLSDPNRVPVEHTDELCETARAETERRFELLERELAEGRFLNWARIGF